MSELNTIKSLSLKIDHLQKRIKIEMFLISVW